MKKNATRMLVEGALFVALAHVLGYLKLGKGFFPNGGSVSLLMLPILVYAVRWGVSQGLLAGLVLGILQFALDGGIAIGWPSIFGDYLIACGLLGLAGLGKGKPWGIIWGGLIGMLGRFASIFVTGAVLWGVYMPDEFFGMTMTNEWFYSLLYNGSYMLPSIVACIVALLLLYKPLGKYLRGDDIK